MNGVYIALGSNIGDRFDHLLQGKNALAEEMDVMMISPVYDTEPVGTAEPDRYLNAVLSARTNLSPEELLSLCLTIERENGRQRSVRNAPRTLDLDLLFYDDLCLETPDLTLPHPRMHERAFVLAPFADIAPDAVHPKLGLSVQKLFDRCEQKERLVRRTEYSL